MVIKLKSHLIYLKMSTLVNLKVLNANLYLKILHLKFKFKQFVDKIKISSDLLEDAYTSQFEGAGYESDIGDLSRHYTVHLTEIT